MKFFTKYNPPESKPTVYDTGSLTCQEYKDEADINNIVKLPNLGINPLNPPTRVPSFGDFTAEELNDYQKAQNIIAVATQMFEQLPSRVRERFSNDPAKLIEFVKDDSNYEEAKRLGMVETPLSSDVIASINNNVTESVTSPQKPSVEATSGSSE